MDAAEVNVMSEHEYKSKSAAAAAALREQMDASYFLFYE